MVKKLDQIRVVLSEGEWFSYPSSVLRIMSCKREKKSRVFSSLFNPEKTKYKKVLTSFLGKNVAYIMLVQFAKLWTLFGLSFEI